MLTDELTEVEAGTSVPPTQENIVRPMQFSPCSLRLTPNQMQAVREFIIHGQDNTDYVLFCKSRRDYVL